MGIDGDYEVWCSRRTTWRKKFAFLPHQSVKSGKCIWFNYAYLGIEVITGPGDPAITEFWMTEDEFIIMTLKGSV